MFCKWLGKINLRFFIILFLFFPVLSLADVAMNLLHHNTLTSHPCPDLNVTCFTNKGHHLVGFLLITQLPRMVRDKIVCLPHGKLYSKNFIEKTIHQCNITYPFSCKKGGGCAPSFQLKSS